MSDLNPAGLEAAAKAISDADERVAAETDNACHIAGERLQAEAAVRAYLAAAGRAALPDPPRDCTCGEFCSGCGGRRAVTPDEGWSPGIDDPGPPALGDIDTGEGWYQT